MTRAEAIALLECSANELADTLENVTANESVVAQLQRYVDAYNMGIAALREQGDSCGLNNAQLGRVIANSYIEGVEDCKAGRSPLVENKPLTLEELREMDGEPVWIVWPDGCIDSRWWIVGNHDWHLMEFFDPCAVPNYGKTWLAYRDKPMEAHP